MVNPLNPHDPALKSAARSFERWVQGGPRPYVARCLSCGLYQPLTDEEYGNLDFETQAGRSICPHCGANALRVFRRERNKNLALLGIVILVLLAAAVC